MKTKSKLLLTSFQPWLSHHRSNSSDDLLKQLNRHHFLDFDLVLLRQLPVNVTESYKKVLNAVKLHQPDGIICCGMAERRTQLTIESCAFWHQEKRQTSVNLSQLIHRLNHTKISHDAGKFVCEGLYYHVLKHCQSLPSSPACVFVHVPLLNQSNNEPILQDFRSILQHFTQV